MRNLTVFITNYNRMDFLKEALDSVKKQNYQCIITDDCSSEITMEELENLKKDYPNIIHIHRNETNQGTLLNKLNIILMKDIIKTDWFIYLDNDDTINNINVENFDVNKMAYMDFDYSKNLNESENYLDYLIHVVGGLSDIVFNKKCIDRFPKGLTERCLIGEDILMMEHALKDISEDLISFGEPYFFTYRFHEGQISNNTDNDLHAENQAIIIELAKRFNLKYTLHRMTLDYETIMNLNKLNYNSDTTYVIINNNKIINRTELLDKVKNNLYTYLIININPELEWIVSKDYPNIKIIHAENPLHYALNELKIETNYVRFIDSDSSLIVNYNFNNLTKHITEEDKTYDLIRTRYIDNTQEYLEREGVPFLNIYHNNIIKNVKEVYEESKEVCQILDNTLIKYFLIKKARRLSNNKLSKESLADFIYNNANEILDIGIIDIILNMR